MTSIQWTDETWNPVTGCTKVSQGCKNCYAERVFPRVYGKRRFTDVRMHPDRLDHPLRWKKPRRVFVNSMSDLFHEDVPPSFILRIWMTMMHAGRHTFQILTKRPERMLSILTSASFSVVERMPHIWLGVSVEDQETADERIPLLLKTPAAVRFVSYEPALGPVDFYKWIATPELDEPMESGGQMWRGPYLHWIIVGGESGPKARPFDVAWARSAIAQCRAAGVACFVKQFGARAFEPYSDGSHFADLRLRDRAGGDPAEWPEDLRVREWPAPHG